MPHSMLRDLAKVGVGIVIADIFSAIWFASVGLLPMTVLGIAWDARMLPEIILFDMALLIILAHLGWNVRLPVASPSERTLLTISGLIFLAVAVVHFLRITFDWQLALGRFAIPLWLSWFGVLVALFLSYSSLHYAARSRRH